MRVTEDRREAAAQGMLHVVGASGSRTRLALITPHGDRTYEDLNPRSTGSRVRCAPAGSARATPSP